MKGKSAKNLKKSNDNKNGQTSLDFKKLDKNLQRKKGRKTIYCDIIR